MALNRVKVQWTGWPGAPGVSTFYVSTTITDLAPLRTFFAALSASYLPSGLTLAFPSTGDVIDEATGLITGAWSGPAAADVVGGAAGSYPGNAGAVVSWRTTLLVAGRRVRGRTFLVPLANAAYQSDGSLSTAFLTTANGAAATLISTWAGGLKVWSRPRPTIAGAQATVLTGTVPDLAVSLRTRRT